jgi:hypothetical protein
MSAFGGKADMGWPRFMSANDPANFEVWEEDAIWIRELTPDGQHTG